MSFKDKVVIVTGAGSGIGAATAVEFSKEGARVVLVDRDTSRLEDISKQCKDSLTILADLSKDEDVKRVMDETIKKYKHLDILINNAGISPKASLFDGNILKCYDDTMNVNLRAAIHLTSLAAPHLAKTKGSIVNMSSTAPLSLSIPPIFSMYTVSKAALSAFTSISASELAPSRVRVNAICPGPVRTRIIPDNDLPITTEELLTGTALNRISEPVEIADLILFLASDKAKAITGSNFISDNGYLLRN